MRLQITINDTTAVQDPYFRELLRRWLRQQLTTGEMAQLLGIDVILAERKILDVIGQGHVEEIPMTFCKRCGSIKPATEFRPNGKTCATCTGRRQMQRARAKQTA